MTACDAHVYVRIGPWPLRRGFVCLGCGLVTRHWSAQYKRDQHEAHMTMPVAKRGYNIGRRSWARRVIALTDTAPRVIDLTEPKKAPKVRQGRR